MSEQPDGARFGGLAVLRRVAWIAVIVVALGALGMSYVLRRNAPPQLDIGGAFALTDQNGKRVTDQDLKGKVLAVYFGFTHCPDACPTSLQKIRVALDQLPAEARGQVIPVFITLDPERDTPQAVGEYVNGLIPGGVGLTGTTEQIADVARAYRMGYSKVPTPGSALPYTIDHASLIYVMGRDGKFVRYFPSDATAEQVAEGLKEAAGKPARPAPR